MSEKEKQSASPKGVRDEIRQQHQKTKNMTSQEKLKYFWDYYKVHTIGAIIALLLLISLIHSIATTKDRIFSAYMLNASQVSSEELSTAFVEYAGLDAEKYDCLIDTSFNLTMQTYGEYELAASQKLVAMAQTNDLDAVVMNSDIFYNYSLVEMFTDLRNVLTEDELAAYEDKLYYIDYAEVEKANENTDYDEEYTRSFDAQETYSTETLLAEAESHRHPENMETPVPVGIYMESSPFITKTGIYEDGVPIFGIVSTSNRMENSKKYLDFLWDEAIDFSQMTTGN